MQGKLHSFKTESQCAKILAHFQKGKYLTVMEALKLGYGATLRSRVSDIRDAGFDIISERLPTDSGFVARYHVKGAVNKPKTLQKIKNKIREIAIFFKKDENM